MTATEPTAAPDGYLDVTGLEDVSYKELAERRAWLLDVIGVVGPGADHPGVRAAALALVAVITELDTRARQYTATRDHLYSCLCGYHSAGLAAFEEHLDRFPPEGPCGDAHVELAREFAAELQPDEVGLGLPGPVRASRRLAALDEYAGLGRGATAVMIMKPLIF